jgi:Protein of unknown function (DUF2750)
LRPTAPYAYFIKRVADSAVVWSLSHGDQFVLEGDARGPRVVPLWPHKRYAEACRVAAWAEREPIGVHIDDFLEQVIAGAEADGLEFAVFLVADASLSAHVRPATLRDDLRAELANY